MGSSLSIVGLISIRSAQVNIEAKAAQALATLVELPDFNIELFLQPIHDFPNFAKLPAEIRVIIWRSLFPRTRRVQVSVDNPIIEGEDPFFCSNPPLIAAHVCHESRAETNRRYLQLFHERGKNAAAIWLDPRKETLCLHECERDLLDARQWLRDGEKIFSCLDSIKYLELTGFRMFSWYTNYLEPFNLEQRFVWKYFKNLRYLRLLGHSWSTRSLSVSKQEVDELMDKFAFWFSISEELDPTYRFPDTVWINVANGHKWTGTIQRSEETI